MAKLECDACQFRGNCLSGLGQPGARLMVVFDYPYGDDLRNNAAMSGKAGLLQRQVLGGVGLDPDKDVYYTYAIKGDTKGATQRSTPARSTSIRRST